MPLCRSKVEQVTTEDLVELSEIEKQNLGKVDIYASLYIRELQYILIYVWKSLICFPVFFCLMCYYAIQILIMFLLPLILLKTNADSTLEFLIRNR